MALRVPFSRGWLWKIKHLLTLITASTQLLLLVPWRLSWPTGNKAMKILSDFSKLEKLMKHYLQIKPSSRDTAEKDRQPSPLSNRTYHRTKKQN